MMRRVVVTGLGMVSPLGCGVEATWQRILKGESGARQIDTFEVSDIPSRIACMIPRGDGSNATFNPDQWMDPKDQRKVDDFIIFAMCATQQALDDAGWYPKSDEDQWTTGTQIGSGIGGINGIAETAILLKERGPRRVSPFFIPGRLINLAAGYVSIFLAPLSLLRMRLQVGSTPQPRGDTMPRPVTTTRLISTTPTHDSRPKTRNRWTVRPRPGRLRQHRAGASAFRVLFKKFRGVTDGQNRLRRVIGNFATEFFFERHHKLDRIEAVGAEVINEACVVDHFFGLNTKVFDHDLLNPLANLTHRSTSCLFPLDPSPRRYEPSWSVNYPSQSRIVLIWPSHSRPRPGERRQAPHRQYTGFQNPARRSLPIRWWFGYHTSQALTISLNGPSETAFRPRRGVSNRLKSWPFHH